MTKRSLSVYSYAGKKLSHKSKDALIKKDNIHNGVDSLKQQLFILAKQGNKSILEVEKKIKQLTEKRNHIKFEIERLKKYSEFRQSVDKFMDDKENLVLLGIDKDKAAEMQYESEVELVKCGYKLSRVYKNEQDYKVHDVIVKSYTRYYFLPYVIDNLAKNPKAFPWPIENCKALYEKMKSKMLPHSDKDYQKYRELKAIFDRIKELEKLREENKKISNMLQELALESRPHLLNSHAELRSNNDELLTKFKPSK